MYYSMLYKICLLLLGNFDVFLINIEIGEVSVINITVIEYISVINVLLMDQFMEIGEVINIRFNEEVE